MAEGPDQRKEYGKMSVESLTDPGNKKARLSTGWNLWWSITAKNKLTLTF